MCIFYIALYVFLGVQFSQVKASSKFRIIVLTSSVILQWWFWWDEKDDSIVLLCKFLIKLTRSCHITKFPVQRSTNFSAPRSQHKIYYLFFSLYTICNNNNSTFGVLSIDVTFGQHGTDGMLCGFWMMRWTTKSGENCKHLFFLLLLLGEKNKYVHRHAEKLNSNMDSIYLV